MMHADTADEKRRLIYRTVTGRDLDELVDPDPDIAAFLRWLVENGYLFARRIGRRRFMAFGLTATGSEIVVGQIGDKVGWSQQWMFKGLVDGLDAFAAFDPVADAEPSGWVRHMPSCRRREDGDPARETIRP